MTPTNTLTADWSTIGNVFTGTNTFSSLTASTIQLTGVDSTSVLDERPAHLLTLGLLFGLLVGLVVGIGLSVAFSRARQARRADASNRFPSHGI